MEIKPPLPDVKLRLPDTVEACHEVIKDYHGLLQRVLYRLEQLEAENRSLRLTVSQLQERLHLNSRNSSKSPSSDFKRAKKKKSPRRSSGKPSGGQPGHTGHYRALLETEAVDEIVECTLNEWCSDCGKKAMVASDEVVRHQVHELPPVKLTVTEYQLAKGHCGACGHKQTAPLPEGVSWGITGPRLSSFMSLMVSEYYLSRRALKRFLSQYLQFDISLGTIFNKQRLVNVALAEPVKALLPVAKQSHCHMDETGHIRDGQRHWLWVVASSRATYFEVIASRGKKVIKELMSGFEHIVISDRYSAYTQFDSSQRQLCWAHLKRDFQRFSERRDPIISRIGKELLSLESDVFKLHHKYKEGKLPAYLFERQMTRLRRLVGEALEKGSYTAPELRLARFCQNLLKHFDALWTFLEVEGVEPTNNTAERCLRPLVIWRKSYFGTRSDYGSEFVARTASLLMTAKLHSINPFDYLSRALYNHFSGIPAPPILPA